MIGDVGFSDGSFSGGSSFGGGGRYTLWVIIWENSDISKLYF